MCCFVVVVAFFFGGGGELCPYSLLQNPWSTPVARHHCSTMILLHNLTGLPWWFAINGTWVIFSNILSFIPNDIKVSNVGHTVHIYIKKIIWIFHMFYNVIVIITPGPWISSLHPIVHHLHLLETISTILPLACLSGNGKCIH